MYQTLEYLGAPRVTNGLKHDIPEEAFESDQVLLEAEVCVFLQVFYVLLGESMMHFRA